MAARRRWITIGWLSLAIRARRSRAKRISPATRPAAAHGVLDPDDSRGPGLNTAGNGDELTVNFSDLEPVDTDTPATNFDVILNSAANTATIQNGGTLNGANAISVVALLASFESFNFANKTNVRIMGQLGGDTFNVNYTIAAAGLATLGLFGHVAPRRVGTASRRQFRRHVQRNCRCGGVPITASGNGGNDAFNVGTGDLSLILSPVAVIGGDGKIRCWSTIRCAQMRLITTSIRRRSRSA